MRPDGNCRACMVEIKGERVLAPSCCRAPAAGMEVSSTSARAVHAQKIVVEMLVADVPRTRLQARFRACALAPAACDRQAALRRARAAGAGPLAPCDGSQPRRLHPVHALRTRLPRSAGQRRDRLRVSWRTLADRVRPQRPDGRVDLRGVRRMRAGVPHGRARSGEGCLSRRGRSRGGLHLPVLRRRLSAHLPCQGRCDRPRRGPRRSRQPRASLREGALRLRLCSPSAAADEAADQEGRRAQIGHRRDGSRQSALGVPGSELGGGDRARRRHACEDPRRARRWRARRLRVGQGLQRGGVPVPEARAHGLRHQQRRSLHAALPRVERGGLARGHRIGRGVESGDGCDAGGGGAADRRQSGRQSSGRGDVDQERGQARHEADPRRAAALRARAARHALPAVQAGHRRRAAQRDDPHDHRRGARCRELRRRAHERLRRAADRMQPGTVPRRWRRSAAFRRRPFAKWRVCTRRPADR